MRESWSQNEYLYRGRIVSLLTGEARLEDGSIVRREVVEHTGGVAIVPVLNNNSVILIRQFRISIGRELLELPGGRLEPGESPEGRARVELEEETGYRASSITSVTSYYPCPGFSNLRVSVFLAFDLERTERNLEWDEKIELVVLPFEEVRRRLLAGEFEDGNTIIGLFGLFAYLQGELNAGEEGKGNI